MLHETNYLHKLAVIDRKIRYAIVYLKLDIIPQGN